MTRKRKSSRQPNQPPPATTAPADSSSDAHDVVEQASEESFPASDAPSWVPLHTGVPGKHPDRQPR